jgi:hypothetical protein
MMFPNFLVRPCNQGSSVNKLVPLRTSPARLREFSRSLFGDLSAVSVKVLAPIVVALLAVRAQNYGLDAFGVIRSLGPFKVALAAQLVGVCITRYVYRPSLLSGWSIWGPALILGVSRGVNNVVGLYTFVWIRPQFVAPLSFVFQAVFTLGGDIIRDARTGKYATAIWPILAVPGIWALVVDSGNDGTPRPGVPIFGYEIPGWILGVGTVIIAAATYAFNNNMLQIFAERDRERAVHNSANEKDVAGQISCLAGIPSAGVLALGALFVGDGWGGMTSGNWLNFLFAALAGIVTGLTSVVTVKAYQKGLKREAITMIQPFMTLAGILMGMLVEMKAPGLLAWPGMALILLSSLGAAKYQNQEAERKVESSRDEKQGQKAKNRSRENSDGTQ